ncbi:MAG: GH3 auxin-responsive promoter family protein [Saprospiraceae bacterium]|nr:GH3 auxin-responsive promoter family protein [Saprospiraceae bacterium]
MPILSSIIKRGLTLGEKFERQNVAPIQLQTRTLRRLLRMAGQTTFGQYYDFKELLKSPNLIEDFQQKVPIHNYDTMYERWWHMTLNQVENVTWPGKVKYFALSSGTSGAPSKHIPVTDHMIRAIRRGSTRMFFNLNRFNIDPELFTKGMLLLGGSTNLQNYGDYFLGDLSGINAGKIPFWLRPFYKPGVEISRINNWNDKIEEIAKHAPEWDVAFMVGIPAWIQLMMERIIEVNKVKNIHEVWPNLTVYVHGGVHFEPYRKGFEKLVGKPLVYMDSYLASEGLISFQNRPDTRSMRMLMHNGIFFEFVPFNEDNFDEDGNIRENVQALSIDKIENGVNYALLMSTCAGAWRYLIGDTVKFTDKERAEIIVTGRTKHYLSIVGEHLSVDNMNQAVRAAEEILNIDIREFTVSAVQSGNFFAHRWYVGCHQKVDVTKLAKVLDEQLKIVNDDYRIERDHVLQDIELEVIAPETFNQWLESRGKLGGQNKFPRVMKKDLFEEWERFVRQSPAAQMRSDEVLN